jgi:hypothetical protein
MRKLLASVAGALGLLALVRALRRKHAPPAPEPATPDPAEELRRTIAGSRSEEPAASETPAAPPEPTSIEERRRLVHERAQEAIEAMREPPAET